MYSRRRAEAVFYEGSEVGLLGPVSVGTCGFQRSRKLHFSNLDVVEVQQTFYDPPSEDRLRKWASEAGGDFEFTVKVWMLITHEYNRNLWRRIKREVPGDPESYGFFKLNRWTLWALEETLKAARALGSRILVFQTPRSFRPTDENVENLRRFLKETDLEEYTVVWEPRGGWWDKPELLAGIAAELGIIISGDILRRWEIQLFAGEIVYTRLHGLGGRGEVNYRYKYTDEDLRALSSRIGDLLSGKPKRAYVLFNNVYAYDDALRFKTLLSASRV